MGKTAYKMAYGGDGCTIDAGSFKLLLAGGSLPVSELSWIVLASGPHSGWSGKEQDTGSDTMALDAAGSQ